MGVQQNYRDCQLEANRRLLQGLGEAAIYRKSKKEKLIKVSPPFNLRCFQADSSNSLWTNPKHTFFANLLHIDSNSILGSNALFSQFYETSLSSLISVKASIINNEFSSAAIDKYFQQLLGALTCLHDAGSTHKDIRPLTIVVTPTGDLKLLNSTLLFGCTSYQRALKGDKQIYLSPSSCLSLSKEEPYPNQNSQREDLFQAGMTLLSVILVQPLFSLIKHPFPINKLQNKLTQARSRQPRLTKILEKMLMKPSSARNLLVQYRSF